MQEVMRSLGDKLTRLYPESTLLEYLLNAESPVLLTVEKYLDIHASVPLVNLYSGNNVISVFIISVKIFSIVFNEVLLFKKKERNGD